MVCSHSSCIISLHAALLLEKKEYPHFGLCMWMQWKSAQLQDGQAVWPLQCQSQSFWNLKSFARCNKLPLMSCWLPLQTCDVEDQNTDEVPGFAEITSYKSTYMKRGASSSLSVIHVLSECFPLRNFSRLSEKSHTRVCGGWCLHKVNINIPLRKREL